MNYKKKELLKIMNNLPEAPVTMFTNYKREDGFEVSLTLRGEDLKTVATNLDEAIKAIMKKGGTPVSRQKAGYPPKTVDYIENRVCPLDGGKLIKPPVGTNRPIKCENGKYDFATKTTVGCQFTEWEKPAHVAEVEKVMARNTDTYNPDEVPDNINF